MERAVACYREFAPIPALREHVRAFFSFAPAGRTASAVREVVFGENDAFCSPLFADGDVSLVFSFDRVCHADGRWRPNPAGPSGIVIGPMNFVGPSSDGNRPEMVGVYFRPGCAGRFIKIAASEVADRIVPLDELWPGSRLTSELSDGDPADRVDRLESVLLSRLRGGREPSSLLDIPGLARLVRRRDGRVTVQALADAAGVSRQHLTRAFRERIGLTPKTYCRIARFQAGLVYAGRADTDWAQVAAESGYADQSHLIAEFRRFSSLTPRTLASRNWFHPFIESARFRSRAKGASAPSPSRSAAVSRPHGTRAGL